MTEMAEGSGQSPNGSHSRDKPAAKAEVKPKLVYYKEIRLSPSLERPRRLAFIAASGTPKLPGEMLTLREEYEKTARVAALLFDNSPDDLKEIFSLLHMGADRGLRGPDFNLEDGRGNLVVVQENITDLALSVRDRRLRDYSVLMAIFGVCPLVIRALIWATYGFGYLTSVDPNRPVTPYLAGVIAFFWIPAGAAICVWGEFALRMQAGLTYDHLLSLDPSRWRPGQRLLVTIGVAFIFSFLLYLDVIKIGMGNVLLDDFATKNPAVSLAVGGITAFAFANVEDIIFRIRPERNR